MVNKTKRRGGCAECGCQGKKGGYKYTNSKKRTRSRIAKGIKKYRLKKKRTKRRKRVYRKKTSKNTGRRKRR